MVGELDSSRPQRGDCFIDRAVRLRAGIGLRNPASVEQAGRPIVALARGDRTLGDRGPTTR
jgi:hypothetical protein